MEYITFPGTDIKASRLGMGAMRLPLDSAGAIDEKAASEMLQYGIDHGLNYLDTAFPYHGQTCEAFVGKFLKNGNREKVTLVTKLPVWLVKTRKDMDRLLDEQLEKLQTDHVDFYLLHALNKERFELMKQLDYKQFFADKIREGKIRYPGFSFHDDHETFMSILNDYDWKLAQVQMNILDVDQQATLEGIKAAAKKGTGVVIMEPLRGGALAKATGEVKELYDAYPDKRSCVEWAFRYLMDMPENTVILSGMSSLEQLKDNLEIFERSAMNCMTAQERELIDKVRLAYRSRIKTGCTGCEYCQPCPQGVAIPQIFRAYDQSMMLDNDSFAAKYAKGREKGTDASRCIACGQCESACPQQLPIIRYLQEIDQTQS